MLEPLATKRNGTAASVTRGWFDAHVLTGAHPAHRTPSSSAGAIEAHLDRYELSGALVGAMASWLHDPAVGNTEASQVATRLAHRGVLGCWCALPPTPGEQASAVPRVARAVDAGAAAFRLYPASHGYSAVDPVMNELYAELAERRMPLCVDRTEAGWAEIATIASRFPELDLVVSQIGYRELRALATLLPRHPGLHVDLVNFASHEGVEWLVERFGAARLLFATGLGLRDPGESVMRLAWSGLDGDALAAVGSGTARRLLAGSATVCAASGLADQLGAR
jgi:hypothetical protein